MEDIRARISELVFREHAILRLLERNISPDIIKEAMLSHQSIIIEEYQDASRGPCCLIAGKQHNGRSLHIVLGIGEPLCVITAYDPSIDQKNRWAPPDYLYRNRPEVSQEQNNEQVSSMPDGAIVTRGNRNASKDE